MCFFCLKRQFGSGKVKVKGGGGAGLKKVHKKCIPFASLILLSL